MKHREQTHNIQGFTLYAKSVCYIIDVAVHYRLFHEQFWVSIVDISNLKLVT